MSSKIVVIGGNGRVARHVIRLLVKTHDVTGIVREPAHEEVVKSLGAKPLVVPLDAPVSDYTAAIEGAVAVFHCSGYSPPVRGPDEPPVPREEQDAGSKAEHDATIKAYDAIDAVVGPKPRLIMMSGVDIREASKVPEHYNEEDLKISAYLQADVMMGWKFKSDKALRERNAFRWVILRPGGFSDESGTGKVAIGRTHLMPLIPREDVAAALVALLDRDDASGLGIDVVGGEVPIQEALDAFIKKGETDFIL